MTLKRGLFGVNRSAARYGGSMDAAARWLLARTTGVLHEIIIRGGVSIVFIFATVVVVRQIGSGM